MHDVRGRPSRRAGRGRPRPSVGVELGGRRDEAAPALGVGRAAVVGVDQRAVPALAALVDVGDAGGEELGEQLAERAGVGRRPRCRSTSSATMRRATGSSSARLDQRAERRLERRRRGRSSECAARPRGPTSPRPSTPGRRRAGQAADEGVEDEPGRSRRRPRRPSAPADQAAHHRSKAASARAGSAVSAARRARASAERFVSWVDSVGQALGPPRLRGRARGVPLRGRGRRRATGRRRPRSGGGAAASGRARCPPRPWRPPGPVSCWNREGHLGLVGARAATE